jgi:N-acetylmuramoyl-L-alanine amidase
MTRIIYYSILFVCLTIASIEINQHFVSPFYTPLYSELNEEERKQIDCLTQNIYREAGIEEERGMTAVALVTMNRVKAEKFPSSVCEVVKQRRKNVCQFSWMCTKNLPNIDERIYSYSRSLAIKVFFNHDLIDDITEGALFYHATYVKPRWDNLKVTTKIGRHIFYKPIGEV